MSTQDVTRFHCKHEGCEKSFARKEHLNRHERTHLPTESLFVCNVCNQKFNRTDSLHRHLVRHGAEFKPTPSGRSKKACIACHKGKIKCDGIEPCSKCASKGSACVYEKQPTQPRQNEDAILPPFSKLGLIDWASMKVQKASEDPAKSESGFELDDPTTLIRPTVSEEAEKAHLDSYFRYFHHRWPIVHRPSYMSSTHLQPLLCAMNMIGALESGNGRSKMYGMVMQDYLMHRMPPLLGRKTSKDRFQGTLPTALCQTALLVVINSLNSGVERLASSGTLILGTLVTILREAGFFDPNTSYKDEKPGFFVPMHEAALSERQRLAQYIFKIDSYFSIIRDRPPYITLDELHFLPATSYALHNGDGLDVWESRKPGDPHRPEEVPMSELYHIELSNFGPGNNSLFFVEDIQMCMCATVPEIRQLHKEPVESVAQSMFSVLKLKLDGLKCRLDQMASQQPNPASFGDEEHLPYRYYYGYEDPSQEGWQIAAIMRAKTLIFDALSFYHVLCMHLYSHVSKMRQLDKDLRNDNTVLNERHRNAQDLRRLFIGQWADTFKASAALHHANQILSLHQSLALDCEFEKRGLDHMTFVGLRTAMLIVWTFCMFGHKPCFHCDSSPDANNKIYVEIDGLQVCLCNTHELVEKFRAFCPERWGLPEMDI